MLTKLFAPNANPVIANDDAAPPVVGTGAEIEFYMTIDQWT